MKCKYMFMFTLKNLVRKGLRVLNLLRFQHYIKFQVFRYMGKIFGMEFQRYPLKFPTKYLTNTLKDVHFIQMQNFIGSLSLTYFLLFLLGHHKVTEQEWC